MDIRAVNSDDFHIMPGMLDSHGHDQSILKFASKTGIAVEKNGDPLGYVFLYFTNSPIVFLDLLVVKKDIDKDERTAVIDALVESAEENVKKNKYSAIMASPIFKKSCNRLVEKGWDELSGGTYWKELK